MNERCFWSVWAVSVALCLSACSRTKKPPPGQAAPIPHCRLEKPLPQVERTFAEAFKRAREVAKLPQSRWALNPATVDPSIAGLFLVTDARRGETDPNGCPRAPLNASSEQRLDDMSIRTICKADGGNIYCSAAAVRWIVEHDIDKSSPVSSFLFYLFMHELGHVALGHPGALSAHGFSINLAQPAATTLGQLAKACLIDTDQLARETAADDVALKAMSKSFKQAPFAGNYKPIEALVGNSERAYQSAIGLFDWAAEYYGSRSGVLGPITDDVCELIERRDGVLELPTLGGDHPPIWRRVAELMSSIGRAVGEIKLPADADPELGLSVSTLRMNVMTAGLRSQALEAATKQFCAMVSAKQAGTLDCSPDGIAKRRTIDLPPSTSEHGQGKYLVFPKWTAHREPAGSPHLVYASFSVYGHASDAKEALSKAKSFADLAEKFLVEIDAELAKTEGYVVYHNDVPVEWAPPMFGGDYTINGDLRLILRVSPSFDPTQLPSAKAAIAAGIDVHASSHPWKDVKEMIVMQFFRADEPADKDSKRLMSHPQPLDYSFDLEKARAGSPNVMSADFHRLLCYARRRLEREYKHPFSLTAHKGPSAFYIAELFIDFPDEWRPLAETGCPDVSRIDDAVIRRLDRLADYGKDPQDVSDQDFKKIFRSTAAD